AEVLEVRRLAGLPTGPVRDRQRLPELVDGPVEPAGLLVHDPEMAVHGRLTLHPSSLRGERRGSRVVLDRLRVSADPPLQVAQAQPGRRLGGEVAVANGRGQAGASE